MKNDTLLSIKDVASALGVSVYTVRRLIKNDKLKATKKDDDKKSYYISIDDLKQYADQNNKTNIVTANLPAIIGASAVAGSVGSSIMGSSATAAAVTGALPFWGPIGLAIGLEALLFSDKDSDDNESKVKQHTKQKLKEVYQAQLNELHHKLESQTLQLQLIQIDKPDKIDSDYQKRELQQKMEIETTKSKIASIKAQLASLEIANISKTK